MKRLNDLLSGKEKIKVASVNTSVITAGYNLIKHIEVDDTLEVGAFDFSKTYVFGAKLSLETNDYGAIMIGEAGISLFTAEGTNINCFSPLTLNNYSTALRPTSQEEGSIIYDSTLKKCILYNGTAWVNLDGTALA